MKDGVYVVHFGRPTSRLNAILDTALDGYQTVHLFARDLVRYDLTECKILFTASVDRWGMADGLNAFLLHTRKYSSAFLHSCGALIVDGVTELYTKDIARTIVLAANLSGCAFMGKPLVEATATLRNFFVLSHLREEDVGLAYRDSACELVKRLSLFELPTKKRARIVVLHASNRKSSNTMALGALVRDALPKELEMEEYSLASGGIYDCNGCSYKTCAHFAETSTCFYGGSVAQEIFPAIALSDGVFLLCPNYNDALSANFSAMVNRLNALALKTDLKSKYVFAVVVSGYSGSDIVAKQLLDGFCLNKGMILPPYFTMLETSNDPGSVLQLPGIRERAATFAHNLTNTLLDK